jgi:endonuclease YncB( thermonuclease family)
LDEQRSTPLAFTIARSFPRARESLRRHAEVGARQENHLRQTYDRCAAICTVDGADIAEELVRQGLGPDCPRFSGGRYQQAELRGRRAGRRAGRNDRGDVSPARLLPGAVSPNVAMTGGPSRFFAIPERVL